MPLNPVDQTIVDVQRFLASRDFASAEIAAEPEDINLSGEGFKRWVATHASHGYPMREFHAKRRETVEEITRLISEALKKRNGS